MSNLTFEKNGTTYTIDRGKKVRAFIAYLLMVPGAVGLAIVVFFVLLGVAFAELTGATKPEDD